MSIWAAVSAAALKFETDSNKNNRSCLFVHVCFNSFQLVMVICCHIYFAKKIRCLFPPQTKSKNLILLFSDCIECLNKNVIAKVEMSIFLHAVWVFIHLLSVSCITYFSTVFTPNLKKMFSQFLLSISTLTCGLPHYLFPCCTWKLDIRKKIVPEYVLSFCGPLSNAADLIFQ